MQDSDSRIIWNTVQVTSAKTASLSKCDKKEEKNKKPQKLFQSSAQAGETSPVSHSRFLISVLGPRAHLSLMKRKVPHCVERCSFPSSLHLLLCSSCFFTTIRHRKGEKLSSIVKRATSKGRKLMKRSSSTHNEDAPTMKI